METKDYTQVEGFGFITKEGGSDEELQNILQFLAQVKTPKSKFWVSLYNDEFTDYESIHPAVEPVDVYFDDEKKAVEYAVFLRETLRGTANPAFRDFRLGLTIVLNISEYKEDSDFYFEGDIWFLVATSEEARNTHNFPYHKSGCTTMNGVYTR